MRVSFYLHFRYSLFMFTIANSSRSSSNEDNPEEYINDDDMPSMICNHQQENRPRSHKNVMLKSAEHKNYHAHKC